MDRDVLLLQIKHADEMIAARQKQIDEQRAQIAEREHTGQDADKLREALERLELAQALYLQHRNQLAAAVN